MTFFLSKQTTLFIFCKSTTYYGAIIDFGLAVTSVYGIINLQVILICVIESMSNY